MTDETDKRPPDEMPDDGAGPDAGAARGPGPETPTLSEKRAGGRPRVLTLLIPSRWIIGVVAALAVLLAAATIGFAVYHNPDFCGTCHVIEKEVVSFKASPHYRQDVNCQDCHTKPGVFNYFIRNTQAATHIVEYVAGVYQEPITTAVGVANCVECHPKEEIERDKVVGNIRVNHVGLREAGYQCVTCHAGVSHREALPLGARQPQNVMAICARCHNDVDQPATCSICHLNGVPRGYPPVHVSVGLSPKDCAECHSKSFCSECHRGITMPHPGDWNWTHGPVVENRGEKVCAGCHKVPKFCDRCHELHPAGWRQQHPAGGQAKPEKCAACHGPGGCLRCHGLPMPHPAGWQEIHGGIAARGTSVCYRCHTPAGCTSCHGVSLPHSSSFLAGHPSHAASSPALCAKCHGSEINGSESCYGGECHTRGPGD